VKSNTFNISELMDFLGRNLGTAVLGLPLPECYLCRRRHNRVHWETTECGFLGMSWGL
jgi:hypothetical protein